MLEHITNLARTSVRGLNKFAWARNAGGLSFEVTQAVNPRNAPKDAPQDYFVRIHSKKPFGARQAKSVVSALYRQAKKYGKGCEKLEFTAPEKPQRLWAANLPANDARAFFKRNPALKRMLSYSKPFAWVLTATQKGE